jgi:hypothetical protein
MFDPRRAFTPLDGKILTFPELRRKLAEIRAANLRDMPIDFDAHELVQLAKHRRWLTERSDGTLCIRISETKHRAARA